MKAISTMAVVVDGVPVERIAERLGPLAGATVPYGVVLDALRPLCYSHHVKLRPFVRTLHTLGIITLGRRYVQVSQAVADPGALRRLVLTEVMP